MSSTTRLKTIIFIFLSSIIITSCANQPKCDSDEALKLAKDLIKQELSSEENSMAFAMLGMGDESTVHKFVDENIELTNVRTTEKNDELKKCDCASQITFKFSEEFKMKMEESGKKNFIASIINEILNKQFEYNYTLQILDKEEGLFIEGIVPIEDLNGVLTNYIMFAPKSEKKEISEDESENVNTDNVTDDETYGIVKNKEIYVYTKSAYNSKTDDFYIKGDTIYVGELKNSFYFINYEDRNGKSKEGYISKDDIEIK